MDYLIGIVTITNIKAISMRAITENEFKTALADVGISNGQTIMVHSDLTRIGWVANAKSRTDVLDFYFKCC